MAAGDTYEGWANRETWALNLVLSNDQGLSEMTQERVRDALDGTASSDPAVHVREAGEAVQQLLAELTDPNYGVLGLVAIVSMLSEVGSVWRIDWREIGAAWLENLS
jgi:hypothetical protein